MAAHKRRSKNQDTFGVIHDFIDLVDTTFERLTGKRVADWLQEFQQQELSQGEQIAPPGTTMPLADAYAVLGLPQTASMEQVKERYRALARLFHPDAPGGYNEAMKLLNNARQRIKEGRGE